MSGKLLLKLDATHYMLQNHALEDFAFMADPANSRNRSTFYFILARLLFQDEASSKTKFKGFIAPLQQARHACKELPDAYKICIGHWRSQSNWRTRKRDDSIQGTAATSPMQPYLSK